jgi:hypothetical protein
MKSLVEQIKNLFKKKGGTHRSSKHVGDSFRPDRDWEEIIGGIILLNVLIVAWSVSVFLSSAAPTAAPVVAVPVTPSVSDSQKMTQTIALYAQKKNTESELMSSTTEIADPSL